jgi:hypothetical protein
VTPDVPDRLLTAWWLRYGCDLPQRPGEAPTAYVVRLKAMDWRALPPPLQQYVETVRGLVSATVLASVTGVPFGNLMPDPARN